jgi:hypothetical protein
MYFIASPMDNAIFTTKDDLNSKNSSGVILVRYDDDTLRLHWYGGATPSSQGVYRYYISKAPLTAKEAKSLTDKTSVMVMYNYLHGLTDLAYERDSEGDRTLVFAKPQFTLTKAITPVLDITSTIAKSMIDLQSTDSYKTSDSGTALRDYHTSVANRSSAKLYLKDLTKGDTVLLTDSLSPTISQIVVVSEKPTNDKYVPTVSMFVPLTESTSAIGVLNNGRIRILNKLIFAGNLNVTGYSVPYSTVVNFDSVQVASSSDLDLYLGFASNLINNNAANSSDLKSLFSATNSSFKQNLYNTIFNGFGMSNTTTIDIAVQSGYNQASSLSIRRYNRTKNLAGVYSLSEVSNSIKIGDYATDAMSYLSHMELHPYLEVEWVADYGQNPSSGTTNGIYRIVGLNTSSGQDVSAYYSYIDYLKTNFDEYESIYGKKKLWDKFYLDTDMLTVEDLDAYINSQTARLDRADERDSNLNATVSDILSSLLFYLQVLLLLYGIVLLLTYGLCSFPLGRVFLSQLKVMKYLTFGRFQTPYDVPVKQGIIEALGLLIVVAIVFNSTTLGLIYSLANAVKVFFQSVIDLFDGIF